MAQEGDVRSIHTLGMLYMQGSLHTDQDLSKAASYFQLGADASYSASSGQLGVHSNFKKIMLSSEFVL